MATWQFDLYFVGRDSPAPAHSPEGFELPPFPVSIQKRLIQALDAALGKHRVFYAETLLWGEENGNRITVVLHNELPSECSVRIDARSPNKRFLEAVCTSATATSCVLYSPERRALIEPNVESIAGALSQSAAASYAKDPRALIDSIAKKHEASR